MSNIVKLEKLISIIGDEAFNKLIKQCPGMNVYIPKNYDKRFYDRKQRNKQLRKDYFVDKMDIPDLMVKYNLSKATVYKIIEKR
jgi:Mor family transcriptional regulator